MDLQFYIQQLSNSANAIHAVSQDVSDQQLETQPRIMVDARGDQSSLR